MVKIFYWFSGLMYWWFISFTASLPSGYIFMLASGALHSYVAAYPNFNFWTSVVFMLLAGIFLNKKEAKEFVEIWNKEYTEYTA